MKVFIVKTKWLADPLCNNDHDWQLSLIGKKIKRRDYHNIELKRAQLDLYDVYETLDSAKELSDYRFNHDVSDYDNPDRYTWCDIYEIEIDSNDIARKVCNLFHE